MSRIAKQNGWILQPVCVFAVAICCYGMPVRSTISEDRKNQPTPTKDTAGTQAQNRGFTTETIRGRVVWIADALVRRFGVTSVPEAQDRIVAIETRGGDLHPLVENIRGRAFRRDPQLRDQELEVVVRRFRGSPMVQVIRVYANQPDGLYELDYWCEICAITMYELKDCECCQGPIELRKTKVAAVKKE